MKIFQDPTSSLPAHRPGHVIVALGSKGAVALTGGTKLTWGERLFGGYSSYYLVDTRRTSVSFPKLTCSSKEHGLEFDVVPELTIEVTDPARAVEKGISDAGAALAQPVRRLVEQQAMMFDVRSLTAAKQAIEKALLDLKPDRALRVIDASADVRPDQQSKSLLRQIGEEKLVIEAGLARGRVDNSRRDYIVRLLDDPDQLLAQSIVTKDDTFRAALEMKLAQYANETQRQYELLQTLMDKGMIEAHDLQGKYSHLVETAMRSLAPSRRPAGTLPSPGSDKG